MNVVVQFESTMSLHFKDVSDIKMIMVLGGLIKSWILLGSSENFVDVVIKTNYIDKMLEKRSLFNLVEDEIDDLINAIKKLNNDTVLFHN